MNKLARFLMIIAALAAMACATPAYQGLTLIQDTINNYKLKLASKDVDRNGQSFEGGKVVSTYSYTDKIGQHHKVNYVAAPNSGFVATGDVPQQVQDTPEVALARRVHLAIVEKERARLPTITEDAITETLKADRIAANQRALTTLAEAYRRLIAF